MPAEVVDFLRSGGHPAWSAYDAHLEVGKDEDLVVYAARKQAVAVTTNRDFIPVARRLRCARVVYLRVAEAYAVEAMGRALEWLAENDLPSGLVLRVPRRSALSVLDPLPW